VIRAAGGLVWRNDAGNQKVAIVHRVRYGDEWTLPKGKMEQNETWLQAARREVSEEIGISQGKLKIVSFAGGIVYLVEQKPKIVLFWNMVIDGEFTFGITDSEVTKVEWLSPEKAIKLLKHDKEKNLLKEVWQKGDVLFEH
jgi:8-oxo-dGTP pyrophosphatase MutT (NUDIX family)